MSQCLYIYALVHVVTAIHVVTAAGLLERVIKLEAENCNRKKEMFEMEVWLLKALSDKGNSESERT